MDPAGAGTALQDHDNLNDSHPRALYNSDPQACINPAEHPSPESGLSCVIKQPTEADLREEKVADVKRKSKDEYGWRGVIRNFTPSYGPLIRYTDYQTPPFVGDSQEFGPIYVLTKFWILID